MLILHNYKIHDNSRRKCDNTKQYYTKMNITDQKYIIKYIIHSNKKNIS